MSNDERIRRPKPDRAAPVRNWSTLFEAPSTSEEDTGTGERASRPERSAPDFEDAVTRSVELGYRVVDEYIRQGQQAARRISDRSYGWASMANDLPDLAARFGQHASDLIAVWLELMQSAAAGSAGRMREDAGLAARPGPHPSAPAAGGRAAHVAGTSWESDRGPRSMQSPELTRVQIALDAQQAAEVSLDLRAGIEGRSILVQTLRSASPGKPRLHATMEGPDADGGPRIRIAIPQHTPEGLYTACILDEETNVPVGTLNVRIPPASRKPA
jgi:hypothetical protein